MLGKIGESWHWIMLHDLAKQMKISLGYETRHAIPQKDVTYNKNLKM